MKKLYLAGAIFALAFLLPKPANAFPAADKTAHFGVGYVINDQLTKHTRMTFLERLGTVALIAGAKELSDNHWDNKDFAATIAGCLVVEIHF